MKKLYNVRLYREMLLQFKDIPADSPEQAAEACKERSCDDASTAPNDCDGDTFVAVVEHQTNVNCWQSVPVDFEPQRQRKAARAAILLLDMIRTGVLSLGDGNAEFLGTTLAFDKLTPDWKAMMDAIGWDKAREAVRWVNSLIARVSKHKGSDLADDQETKRYTQYAYCRGSDGVDDTWDIYDPYGEFVVSIRFWDDPDSNEAAETEARAKLIVETLNAGYWW